MSEHSSGPDTDGVDRAILVLVDDIGARSRPPGADIAVRSAGRRRAASAIAVVAVLVLGAVLGGWALLGSRPSTAPVVAVPSTVTPPAPSSASTDGDVPMPARLTLTGLNTASRGWVRWAEGTADVTDVPSCLSKTLSLPEPRDSTIDHVHVQARTDAFLERMRYASRDDSNRAMRAVVEKVQSCPEDKALFNDDISADLEVVQFSWGAGDRAGSIWLVNFDDRMDIVEVRGATRPDDTVIDRVSRLVAADVQVP
ncbi:hypothetical protein [uncultured Friedmanniella sp.]|uniref:hypothetical protein n=1 Tax=uncultured Friedmanniella sp. TaxID=335381 RepID=UPI0035CA28A3